MEAEKTLKSWRNLENLCMSMPLFRTQTDLEHSMREAGIPFSALGLGYQRSVDGPVDGFSFIMQRFVSNETRTLVRRPNDCRLHFRKQKRGQFLRRLLLAGGFHIPESVLQGVFSAHKGHNIFSLAA